MDLKPILNPIILILTQRILTQRIISTSLCFTTNENTVILDNNWMNV